MRHPFFSRGSRKLRAQVRPSQTRRPARKLAIDTLEGREVPATVWVSAVPTPRTTEGSGSPAAIDLRRDGDLSQPLSVSVSLSGTATHGPDYLGSGASFGAGSDTATYLFTAGDDGLAEGSETIVLQIEPAGTSSGGMTDPMSGGSAPGSYAVGSPASATVYIDDAGSGTGGTPPGSPSGSLHILTRWDGFEGRDDGGFRIIRDDTATGRSVDYRLTTVVLDPLGGPPSVPAYMYGTMTFPAGTGLTEIHVPAPEDEVFVGDRRVTLELADGSGGWVPADAVWNTITVWDNDPSAAVWVDSVSDAVEGVQTGFIRLRRHDPYGDLTVGYQLDPAATTATSGTDFAPLPGSVTFADGSHTADIIIDATGPYADSLAEPTEFVAVQLTWAGPAGAPPQPLQPILAQAGVVNQPVGNRPPNFVGDPYSFKIGYATEGGRLVGTVSAPDPDNDPVKYSLEGGFGFFAIDESTGAITVKPGQRVPVDGSGFYTLNVQAKDGKGGTDMAAVNVSVLPLVVLTGDAHATEGGGDKFTLKFVRIAPPTALAQALTVEYDVSWVAMDGAAAASRSDFVLAELQKILPAASNHGTVTIPANQDSVSITFEPEVDGPERLESFLVSLVDTANYVSLTSGVGFPAEPAGSSYFNGFRDMKCFILDWTTLFGENNVDRTIDPHVVHPNDVQQGDMGSCWFTVAVSAIARVRPDAIQSAFDQETATTVRVRFFRGMGPGAATCVTVSKTLDFGRNMGSMTWDTNDAGRTEIWPQVLETAYAKFLGDGDINAGRRVLNGGGNPSVAMGHLTGSFFTETRDTSMFSADALADMVRTALNSNPPRAVVFGTHAKIAGHAGWNFTGSTGLQLFLPRGHAVSAVRLSGDSVVIRDPNRPDEERYYITIPLADLKTYFDSVFIQ